MTRLAEKAQELFDHADIKFNGDRPWDIQVHNDALYHRIFSEGSLGFGEAYMDRWWDCRQLDECTFRIHRADLRSKIKGNLGLMATAVLAKVFNRQNRSGAKRDIGKHYDIGNDLYRAMLDKHMVYTCGYWPEAGSLDEAQEAKLDLVCKKIGCKPGDRILDIGCGWGSFAKFAAEKYGVSVVGITISEEQAALARKRCEGLPIEIRLQDYRDVDEKFDHIISLGMFEHVGPKNHRAYMEMAHRCLNDGGLLLLHTIGSNVSIAQSTPWVEKYIFPGAVIPSIQQLGRAIEGLFVMEDWHNFGSDYAKTTLAWFENFDKGWKGLQSKYSYRFYRMWKFYLVGGSGIARSRKVQLWQIVLSKNGVIGGYQSIR
jgi:cyclopropane-fatty-acyl-phospholipid synthase